MFQRRWTDHPGKTKELGVDLDIFIRFDSNIHDYQPQHLQYNLSRSGLDSSCMAEAGQRRHILMVLQSYQVRP